MNFWDRKIDGVNKILGLEVVLVGDTAAACSCRQNVFVCLAGE